MIVVAGVCRLFSLVARYFGEAVSFPWWGPRGSPKRSILLVEALHDPQE